MLPPTATAQLDRDLRTIRHQWHHHTVDTSKPHGNTQTGRIHRSPTPYPETPADETYIQHQIWIDLAQPILLTWVETWLAWQQNYTIPPQILQASENNEDILLTVQTRITLVLANFDIAVNHPNIENYAHDLHRAAETLRDMGKEGRLHPTPPHNTHTNQPINHTTTRKNTEIPHDLTKSYPQGSLTN